MRYSGISNRLYVEGGCASMADLVAFRTEDTGILIGPIYHFDPVKVSPVDIIQCRAASATCKKGIARTLSYSTHLINQQSGTSIFLIPHHTIYTVYGHGLGASLAKDWVHKCVVSLRGT